MIDLLEDNPVLNDSLCKRCKYRVSRVIEFIEGTYQEDIMQEVQEEHEGDINLVSVVCTLLHIDIDHIVHQCTGYAGKNSLFSGE